MSPFRSLRNLACGAFAVLMLASTPARATDWTDIWYVPSESGWGVNIVHSQNVTDSLDFLFVTFFIYGPTGQPTWLVGNLSYNGTAYSGGLYQTVGTFYAQPWNPAASGSTAVGTATFTPSTLNAYTATLSYTVNGVGTVNKAIERQPLTAITLAGNYVGGQSGTLSGCNGASTYTDKFDLTVTQSSAKQATLVFNFDGAGTCTLSGALEQHGTMYRMPGASYKCGTAVNTTATVFELKATSLGIEGRVAANGSFNGCSENAIFAGALN